MCCGTKRLTEIACPPECIYLATAREHPPAAAVRRQQRDLAVFVDALRDLNRQQAELFIAVNTLIARYQPPQLHALTDEDVAAAAAALAATLETAARGVIYDHRAPTAAAERLSTEIRRILLQDGRGGSAFERNAAVILRRIEHAARTAQAAETDDPRAYLKLLDRVLARRDTAEPAAPAEDAAPRLILP